VRPTRTSYGSASNDDPHPEPQLENSAGDEGSHSHAGEAKRVKGKSDQQDCDGDEVTFHSILLKGPDVQVERCAAPTSAENEAAYRRIRSNAVLGLIC